jgi:hypothetical protein
MSEANAWWSGLRHEGVLLSPIVLDSWLPNGPATTPDRVVDRLRQAYFRFLDDPRELRPFLDILFEDALGHAKRTWRKEQEIPERFKHHGKKPNRVLLNAGKEHQPRFLLLIDDEHVVDDQGKPRRLGLHNSRRRHADLLRLLRASDVKLGVFTNGHHVRLVYAGMDHESWAEWNCEAWFQGGDGRRALDGFIALLGAVTLPPEADQDRNELLARIQESRDRQADLSYVMGTQIREAVELLVEELTDTLAQRKDLEADILAPLQNLKRSRDEELQALYQGAIRCIMRLVVQLYAESRNLLPKHDQFYYQSYSVENLYQLLKKASLDGREEDLRGMRTAWPRLLASWHTIHDGSTHKDLQIQSYGGQLFRPYSANPTDPVLAAIRVLEDPRVRVSDWAVWEILRKLRVGKFKVGRTMIPGPVDFSDLRTEYIGMMYEGLLDYDLRQAREEDGGIVFLSIGDQTALPVNVLMAQKPEEIKRLIKEQSKKSKGKGADEAEESDESESEEEAASQAFTSDEGDDTNPTSEFGDEQFQANVHKWARKAIEASGLFGFTPSKVRKLDAPQRETLLNKCANELVLKAIPPTGMYLVRWSGTRKGSGTFYTKPGLAVPTTIRTLEPLVYEYHNDLARRIVKRPEEILAIKVCDPAMGSGSFLVAALRFLSQALKESFEKYILPSVDDGQFRATETGQTAIGLLTERLIRNRHEDHSGERMESALKRAIVEHCIYGVDLNPLAVELGKLSLWIETMDPTLRFTFLDHKVKCGNSLVGAWLSASEGIEPEAFLRKLPKELPKLPPKPKPSQAKPLLDFLETSQEFSKFISEFRRKLIDLHRLVDESDRESAWNDLVASDRLNRIRRTLDGWCYQWFYNPAQDPHPTLELLRSGQPHDAVEHVAASARFFHWEIEFPDVFFGPQPGFSALIGNPPWEMVATREEKFLSRYHPGFTAWSPDLRAKVVREARDSKSSMGKEIVLDELQAESLANFLRSGRPRRLGYPLEGKMSLDAGFANRALELRSTVGHVGLILHDRLRADVAYEPVRSFVVKAARIRIVVGFINTGRWAFGIHPDRTFSVLIFGIATEPVIIATDYNSNPSPLLSVPQPLPAGDYYGLVGEGFRLPTVDSPRVLAVIRKLLAAGTLGTKIDSKHLRVSFDADISKLVRASEAFAIPENSPLPPARIPPPGHTHVIEPSQFDQYREAGFAWIEGFGRGARWQANPNPTQNLPGFRYVVSSAVASRQGYDIFPRIHYIETTGATNRWPLVATYCTPGIGMQGTPRVVVSGAIADEAFLLASLNSLIVNSVCRRLMTNQHVPIHVLRQLPHAEPTAMIRRTVAFLAGALALTTPGLSALRQLLSRELGMNIPALHLETQRFAARVTIEALLARHFGIAHNELRTLLYESNERRLTFLRETKAEGGDGLPEAVLERVRSWQDFAENAICEAALAALPTGTVEADLGMGDLAEAVAAGSRLPSRTFGPTGGQAQLLNFGGKS